MLRRLLPAVLAALSAIPCAALSPEINASVKMEYALARIEARAGASLVARRLFAATRHVPRREVRGSELSDAIGARGGAKPELVFDAARLPETLDIDAEILLVLNSARALFAFPVPIVEAEQAAWQRTLQFSVERAVQDPAGFGARLAAAARDAASPAAELERALPPFRGPWGPPEPRTLALPEGALARAALLLRLFERDPSLFYRAVEEATEWPRGAVRLAEFSDLYALHSKEIAALKAPPEGAFANLGGRRYPAPLVRAAFLLRGTGEVERLRESFESYDTVGLAAVQVAINRWRKR